MKPRSLTANASLFRVDLVTVRAAPHSHKHHIAWRFLAFKRNLDASPFLADNGLVFSITLSKRPAFFFSHTLMIFLHRPRACCLSSISTTSLDAGAERRVDVAISSPMTATANHQQAAMELAAAAFVEFDHPRIIRHER